MTLLILLLSWALAQDTDITVHDDMAEVQRLLVELARADALADALAPAPVAPPPTPPASPAPVVLQAREVGEVLLQECEDSER